MHIDRPDNMSACASKKAHYYIGTYIASGEVRHDSFQGAFDRRCQAWQTREFVLSLALSVPSAGPGAAQLRPFIFLPLPLSCPMASKIFFDSIRLKLACGDLHAP